MTSVAVELEVNAEQVTAVLASMAASLEGSAMAWWLGEEIGPYLRDRAAKRFEQEGDDVSGPWAPLRPATVNIRATNPDWPVGGEHPINRRTGELEAWVTQNTWATLPHSLGATLRYPGKLPSGELRQKMETAQKGRSDPRTVPRPVLGVNQADVMFVTTRLMFKVQSAAARGAGL